LDRDKLQALIRKHRGSVSATMHKKVAFLLCTDLARRRNTQRVRKAFRFKVPLVYPEFVRECIGEDRLLDIKPFLVPDPPPRIPKPKKVKTQGTEAGVGTGAVTEVGVDVMKSGVCGEETQKEAVSTSSDGCFETDGGVVRTVNEEQSGEEVEEDKEIDGGVKDETGEGFIAAFTSEPVHGLKRSNDESTDRMGKKNKKKRRKIRTAKPKIYQHS
jgi:hypothetical protein